MFSWDYLLVVPYILNNMKMCDTFTLSGGLNRQKSNKRGKNSIFIERNFRENEVKNFVKSTSKFVKILNETERISFVHFREFPSTKISLETLFCLVMVLTKLVCIFLIAQLCFNIFFSTTLTLQKNLYFTGKL